MKNVRLYHFFYKKLCVHQDSVFSRHVTVSLNIFSCSILKSSQTYVNFRSEIYLFSVFPFWKLYKDYFKRFLMIEVL